ncbi:cytochrome c biogenesis CcdA family protein [Acidobacteriota bacterium]
MASKAASFIWGICSVLLSPCHLTSIPLIIGYLSNQRELSAKKAFQMSTIFSVGILTSIAVIGGITAAAGRILGDLGKIGNYAVAIVFLVFGLHLLGILPLNFPGLSPVKSQRKGYISIFSFGLVFGLALGPCTFAFMAPILGIVFNLTSQNLLYGLVLLSAFALGHCTVIIAAGTSTRLVQQITRWDERSKGITIIRKICGVLVVLGGIYLVYSTF